MEPLGGLDITTAELEAIVEGVREPLGESGYQKLKAAIHTLGYVTGLIENHETTIQELRRMLCRGRTEKTAAVLERAGIPTDAAPPPETSAPKPRPPGHGRNGSPAYRAARKIPVAHPALKKGDRCPECAKGKVYRQSPQTLVRIIGQTPVQATVYAMEKFRCNLCGQVFTAETPEGVGSEKYDATAVSMIALLKYGSGLPFYRLEGLQRNLGIPLPSSTQWELVEQTSRQIEPANEELIRQAAQGEVLYNDDTSMTILELMKPGITDEDFLGRTGVFTSGIVSTQGGQKIALFFTGRKHAGENLADVLRHRAQAVGPPIQMCDALARNLPKELKVILSHCIVHGRRRFVEVAPNFPGHCRHVLETLGEVYRNDAITRDQQMSPEDRLRFHQIRSGPLMTELREWFSQQLDEHKVEPNSGLGTAITYMIKYWDALTLFLRQAGAPLDNNLCERTLKKAILHRKNALFYKTRTGAHVGDIFMSLIYTCQLSNADPFDYLTQLQRHTRELGGSPSEWMPWNYLDTLQRTGAGIDSG
jgi:transposase